MHSTLLTLALHATPALQGDLCSAETWLDSLPLEFAQSILWSADHELGSLFEWDFGGDPDAGGGIFNTGEPEVAATVVSTPTHSGAFAASAWISNAFQAQNGNRAVRLMRWTDTHWAAGGDYFPDVAFYSTWVYFPVTFNPDKYPPWDPGDGGWWNIFQFKSNPASGESLPMFTFNVEHDDATQEMSLYAYSKENAPNSFGQVGPPVPLPVGRWVHLEAYYRASTTDAGRVTMWQDGELIIDVDGVQTVLPGADEKPIWGLGNYTNHIVGDDPPGSATIFFDDAAVSTARLSSVLSAWQPIGESFADVGEAPQLEALGTFQVGSAVKLIADAAHPDSAAIWVVGLQPALLPLLGGVLIPTPDVVISGGTVAAGGSASLCADLPAGLGAGTAIYAQAWFADGAPLGFAATNGIAGVVTP